MNRLFGFLTTAVAMGMLSVRRSPLRSGLTSFGILIGVAAVCIVVALGEGAEKAIKKRIDSLGANALYVRPRETARSGAKGATRPKLTERDAHAIRTEVNGVAASAPVINTLGQVSWRDANASTTVVGTSLEYFRARDWKVDDGTVWTPSAATLGEKVCLIGVTVRNELFGIEDPVGRTVRVGPTPFRVIGLLEEKGQGPFGRDLDNVMVMPIATVRAKLLPTPPGQVHQIMVSAESPGVMDRVKKDMTALLVQRHRIVEGAEKDFRIRDQQQMREMQRSITGVLRILLLSVALVSLAVGGIGVMNIMLVSVAERTREIGIRMAIGAREGDILVQFLVEAIVLSLLGGAGGALVAFAAVEGLEGVFGWPMQLSPRALMVAFATSTGIGLAFGFLPARRAARLDPIAALGRE